MHPITVGSKNSGKTHAVTSLLFCFELNLFYDINGNELEQHIILFSQTALNETNIVHRILKYLSDDEYSDEYLEEILIDIKAMVDAVDYYDKYFNLLHKF